MKSAGKSVVFLMGPTASGKTDLAAALLDFLPFEIISVDSALVYRGMNIGASKPDAAFLKKAPHRLIDIKDPAESYSAADFRTDALREIEAGFSNGKIPLLVGGTMLYFRALEQGLSDLPGADERTRARLETELEMRGLPALYQRLSDVDPESAHRIHANDTQRILRALEVYDLTSRPLSAWWREQQKNRLPYSIVKIALNTEKREILHQRIEQRFDKMLRAGLVEEVRRFYARPDMHADLPSMRAVGYRQVWQFLEGELSYDEMREKGIAATRQLAKRQLTWLRSDPDIHWFDALDPNLLEKVLKLLQQTLS